MRSVPKVCAGALCALIVELAFGACAPARGQAAETLEYSGGTPESPEAASESNGLLYSVPVTDARGVTSMLKTRLCRSGNEGPSTLVIINHGSPANPTERPTMKLGSCGHEAAQWFLRRGYVVAFALRRGYGETGGGWAESQGGCDNPDYYHAGLETARDIDAVVSFATRLPFVRPEGVVVVGQSAGGWGTIAYDSVPHPRVAAFVVMAGGRGGHRNNRPNSNCRPDLLVESARHYGNTVATPMLWIYTSNDSYFGPPLARAMWQALSAAGGKADLENPGPFEHDGHHLFFGPGGSKIWGPLIERYLLEQHVSAD